MRNEFNKSNAPCIVSEGILFNKRDMIRALETIENVTYYDIVDRQTVSKGEGVILKVFASKENSTLILNGSLFINVFSFDYLQFSPGKKKGQTVVELVKDSRTLRLIPQEEDIKNPAKLSASNLCRKNGFYDEEEPCPSMLDDIVDEDEES